jgi:hypothetical protein
VHVITLILILTSFFILFFFFLFVFCRSHFSACEGVWKVGRDR